MIDEKLKKQKEASLTGALGTALDDEDHGYRVLAYSGPTCATIHYGEDELPELAGREAFLASDGGAALPGDRRVPAPAGA